jgi:UPF0042 nucleotide-binding protein
MDDPDVAARVRGRRDPRYPAVRDIIAAFDWPGGQLMVPGSHADVLATRVMAAIVTAGPAPDPGEGPAAAPEGAPGATRYACPLPDCPWSHDLPAGALPDADTEATFRAHVDTHDVMDYLTALAIAQQYVRELEVSGRPIRSGTAPELATGNIRVPLPTPGNRMEANVMTTTPNDIIQSVITSYGAGHHDDPTGSSLLVDTRILRNPPEDPAVRERMLHSNGLDPEVRHYVMETDGAQDLVAESASKARILLQRDNFRQWTGRQLHRVDIHVVCGGGRHRSVAVAEEIAARLRAAGIGCEVEHRHIDRPILPH